MSDPVAYSSHVMPTYAPGTLRIERGEGPYVFTAEGTRYLDFGTGIAVNALGHGHPHLVEALTEQAGKIWHASNLYYIPDQHRLAARLCAATFADYAFFCNSGAEAVEATLKIARKYFSHIGQPERYRVITFEQGFHGRTFATLAAGNQAKHIAGFGPMMDGFDQVPLNDLAAVKAAITPETAAILIEPVQGEGGLRAPTFAFLRQLRALCDEAGLLLLFDEVQTGMGHTGKLFAYEWTGVTPDVMAVAKAIGCGFPLGASLATAKAASGMAPGTHGSTYGGNPLATAVGNAVLDVMLADGFLDHVQDMSKLFTQRLAELNDAYPDVIDEVRGLGLLLGIKCKVPNTALVAALMEQHMLAVGAGDNVVRLIPPLIIEKSHIDEAMGCLDAACDAVRRSLNDSLDASK